MSTEEKKCKNCNSPLPLYRKVFCSKQCCSEYKKGKTYEEVYGLEGAKRIKQKRSLAGKKLWREQGAHLIGLMIRGTLAKPNKAEKQLESILNEIAPNEYKYNDGWFLLDGKIPDFVNINGKKKLIELQGCYFHGCTQCKMVYKHKRVMGKTEQLMKQRAEEFANYGYETKYVWEHELKDVELLKQSLLSFVYNPNVEVVKVINILKLEDKERLVYDIETKNNHNFFAYGILVHNSHPASKIPELIEACRNGCGISIGSRYVKGGSIVGWTAKRKVISRVASLIALPISGIHDNTSGFFCFHTSILDGVDLKPDSWKIMLEILVKTRAKAIEVPIEFRDRQAGKSKFTRKEVFAYLKHLFKLALIRYKMLNFMIVGGIGYFINMAIYYPLTLLFQSEVTFLGQHFYLPPFVISSFVAITSNYTMNKHWTFGDRKASSLSYLRYLGMALLTLLLDMFLLFLLVDYGRLVPVLAAALAIAIAFVIRFIVADKWIFSAKGG